MDDDNVVEKAGEKFNDWMNGEGSVISKILFIAIICAIVVSFLSGTPKVEENNTDVNNLYKIEIYHNNDYESIEIIGPVTDVREYESYIEYYDLERVYHKIPLPVDPYKIVNIDENDIMYKNNME